MIFDTFLGSTATLSYIHTYQQIYSGTVLYNTNIQTYTHPYIHQGSLFTTCIYEPAPKIPTREEELATATMEYVETGRVGVGEV